jgi:hypothetical protein
MTQGNFGLFLHQNGDVEAAKTRIETAAKNGNAYWKKVQARLFEE